MLLRITCLGGKARLYDENLSVPQSQSQNSSGELGDVEDSGRVTGKRPTHARVRIRTSVQMYAKRSTEFLRQFLSAT